MAVKVVESAKSGLVSLIQVVLLFALLIAVIAWARSSPDTFQTLVTKVGDAAAAMVIWACDWIVANVPQN